MLLHHMAYFFTSHECPYEHVLKTKSWGDVGSRVAFVAVFFELL